MKESPQVPNLVGEHDQTKKERTVFRIPVGLKPAMQAEAIRLGFEDGRGPGLSKYFIWLHEEHVKAAEQHIKDVVDDAAGFEPSADYIASLGATVAWESMTPGEQSFRSGSGEEAYFSVKNE